jgi:hypothetical protein
MNNRAKSCNIVTDSPMIGSKMKRKPIPSRKRKNSEKKTLESFIPLLINLWRDWRRSKVKYPELKLIDRFFPGSQGPTNAAHISTSYVERQNLTMRMSMRRFTRLTNAFSKKVENLASAVALHFMYYNFGRIHRTLRVTPAMEAGISDHVWTLEEIAQLID